MASRRTTARSPRAGRRPRPAPSLVDEVAARLRDEILSGSPAPGARLESEHALAARFGVARVVVREAVARLRAFGLVTARRGSGALVLDWRRSGGLELLPALLSRDGPLTAPGRALVRELLALRRAIAGELLVEATRRRSPEGIEAMRRAVRASREAALGGDRAALVAADLDFARAVALAAGSLPALLLVNAVVRPLAGSAAIAGAIYAEPARNAAGLEAALAAVERGDPEFVAFVGRGLLEEEDALALERLEAAARIPSPAPSAGDRP
jgi:DNA-binding FadR family transcriptional regulator